MFTHTSPKCEKIQRAHVKTRPGSSVPNSHNPDRTKGSKYATVPKPTVTVDEKKAKGGKARTRNAR